MTPSVFAGTELFLLTGPTAVGKTELALRWAEEFRGEIVSCDSLLFYRGMDIGTAKPSRRERERVRHHLIDVAEPDQPWNIHRYLEEAVEVVRDIRRRGNRILVTGGSGFYLKSFLAPVVDAVEVSPAAAAAVAEWEKEGPEALARRLLDLDPRAGEMVDMKNPRRVKPALERRLSSGKSLQQLQEEMRERSFPFAGCKRHVCLLTRDREELHERIAMRVDQMLEEGLVAEVGRLLARGLEQNPSAASAIGYRETIRHLKGKLPAADLREEIVQNTKRLVKKQLTWFRHQLPEPMVLSLTGREVLPAELFPGAKLQA